ncbi:MAG: V-type ATP synthase subunit E [Clostridia bacterium]|nr:V-type ATP synthase subunit E [Clostridia bacterium]MBN2882070.1 V-type ATP synthase subunit E [Clostridia bacterium]
MDEIRNDFSVNEKLRSFTDMALREAHRKKREMIDEIEKEIGQKKKDSEIHLLEEAYRSMQTGTRLSRKELNEAISQALVDGKSKMFNKRKEIIEDVFRQADKRIEEYKNSDEYPKSMKEELVQAAKLLAEEKFIIMADPEDMDMFRELAASIGNGFTVEKSNERLEGGFILYGDSGKKRVDCSFLTRLMLAREEFLEICRIPIDDGDLLDE